MLKLFIKLIATLFYSIIALVLVCKVNGSIKSLPLSVKKYQEKMTTTTLPPHTDTIPHFHPFQYPLTTPFETALPQTIATNELRDEITLLHLGDELIEEQLPSNGVTSGGDIHPTPLYSEEWISYGQTRGFERYNLRTHEFHDQIVCTKLEEILSACRVLDGERSIFAFMIANLEKPGTMRTRYFKVFDLSEEKPQLLAKMEAGDHQYEDRGTRFVIRDSTMFYLHETERKLVALDFQLQPTSHPFADAYNEHYNEILRTSHITVHPSLPFAIVNSNICAVISWKEGKRDLIPFPYIQKNRAVSEFSFSHDRKFIAWCSVSTKYPKEGRATYWVAKVDEKIPGFIGIPKALGSTSSNNLGRPKATAWARNPYTYIVSEPEGLFWWHIE